jgi:hypothetical protein
MSTTRRNTLRRTLLAAVATPLLLSSLSAATLARSSDAHGQLDHKQTFYSDVSKTVQVGYTVYYCDGDYFTSGYETAYYTFYNYMPPCP